MKNKAQEGPKTVQNGAKFVQDGSKLGILGAMLIQVGPKLGVMGAMLPQVGRFGRHLGLCWLGIGALLDKGWPQDPKMVEKVAKGGGRFTQRGASKRE